jgi:hypothetical protein
MSFSTTSPLCDEPGCASDAWAEDAPVLAGLAAASVQGRVALRGERPRRVGHASEEEGDACEPGRCQA